MPTPDVIRREAQAIVATLPERMHQAFATHAAERPDSPALLAGGTTWTYRQLADIVEHTAEALTARGVRGGDRIMVVSENSLTLAALVLAGSRLDAWPVVVNPRLSEREIDQIRDHCGARLMLYTVEGSEQAADHAARHGATVTNLGLLSGLAVGILNESATAEPVQASGAKQVAALLYTSGTTGNPKGVMLSHHNVLFSAAVSYRMRKLGPGDRIYGVLPMSHIVGFSIVLMSTLMSGASALLVPRYDPAALARSIAEDDITLIYGVPATYQRLLEYEAAQPASPRSVGKLRGAFVAGAPLDLTLKSQVEARLGLPLLNGYGITECSPGISGVKQSDPATDNTVGPVIDGVETRIVRPDGKPVTPGEVGELHARGPNVMLGYYRAPDLTAAAIDADGWFNTGDLARFVAHPDGDKLYIVGRTKELIIRSGFNVYPAEVEAVLATHPDVVQSAVVGRAVEGNEEVVAYVQLRAGSSTTPADLQQFAGKLLTAYKRPSEVVLLPALPASSTGKILKHHLAQAALAAAQTAARA